MKKLLLFFFAMVLIFKSFAQIKFEKGYYIDSTDQKIDCLIKDMEWQSNPTYFKYKLSKDDEVSTAAIEMVKEFGFANGSKYVRRKVNIDISNVNYDRLEMGKDPIFREKEIFLKTLIEGKASLYLYKKENFIRYFYKTENTTIKQLVYRKYKTSYTKVKENSQFKHQLMTELKCNTITIKEINQLEYEQESLLDFFEKYNNCDNGADVKIYEKPKKDAFYLNFRPRINQNSLSIQNEISATRDVDFGSKTGFGFGLEGELILPVHKNKWSIPFELVYQNFMSESNTENGLLAFANYNSIEIPIGLRHYFFLSKNSKIFVNTSYIFDYVINSSIDYKRPDNSDPSFLEVESRGNIAFGAGLKLYDKLSVEMRYQTNRQILGGYAFWDSDYRTVSLIVGYSLNLISRD